ncbi:MAG: response regulator [Deltaproteobacteria bacterium]|nr:response regulator [Deltaproteobacteria bacterium]
MKRKILIVEDNADLLKVLQLLLKDPFETIVTGKGAEAVDIAARERPDLILLDIVMPDMNGLDIARRVRQHPEIRSTPILAMTAKVSRIDEEECILSGCNDFIAKPFTFEQLLPRIEKLLPQSNHQS